VERDLLKSGEAAYFFRGKLSCHSNMSDGLLGPAAVVGADWDAGYHFICLSDHFEAEYGCQSPTHVPCETKTSPRSWAPSSAPPRGGAKRLLGHGRRHIAAGPAPSP